jgi:hypothetical protein
MGAPLVAALPALETAATVLDAAAAAGVVALPAGVAAAVVAAGALLGAVAVFFELEQPTRVTVATTASARIRLVAAIDIPFP